MKNPGYIVEVRPLAEDEGGGWLATFPELPGCMADGETVEQALADAEGALESYILTSKEFGDPVPSPRAGGDTARITLRLPATLHGLLAARAEKEGVSLNTLLATLLAGVVGYGRATGTKHKRKAAKRDKTKKAAG